MIGITIFFFWVAFRSDWLVLAGMINIYAGLVLFLIGVISLTVYFNKTRNIDSQNHIRNSFISLAILLSNFPVAALIIGEVNRIESTSVVIIENRSNIAISNFTLTEDSHNTKYKLKAIAPNQTGKIEFSAYSDCSVSYSFELNGKLFKGVAFGYLTNGMGGQSTIIVTEDNNVFVNESL